MWLLILSPLEKSSEILVQILIKHFDLQEIPVEMRKIYEVSLFKRKDLASQTKTKFINKIPEFHEKQHIVCHGLNFFKKEIFE